MPSHKKSFLRLAVSPLAWPLVLLYAAGVRMKNAGYDFGLSRQRSLATPVISVGNLSVGGTGKTPIVLLLAHLLEDRGWSVDVLSRGYRRVTSCVTRVAPLGDWQEFGDEPYLMAQHGVSTYVGADRFQAGLLAEEEAAGAKRDAVRELGRSVHLLDDGFQHRKLARSLDIVLLRRADLEDEMLPLGRLREPLAALERADICVLRAEDTDLTDRTLRLMGQRDACRVWIVERRTVLPTQTISPISASPALAFCAIGDPRGFFQGLRHAQVELCAEISFRDHHVYTHKDIDRLKMAAKRSGARCFVTTEKDEVRLAVHLRAELEKDLPLIVAGLEVSLREESGCVATLESLLTERLQISARVVR